MGQMLLNPPSVEGWHEGEEWVDSGALVERVNFAVNEMGRAEARGVGRMIQRIRATAPVLAGGDLVEACLEALGTIDVSPRTKRVLVEHAEHGGAVDTGSPSADERIVEMLQAIVATPDFQYC
jgi:hypothetical protein